MTRHPVVLSLLAVGLALPAAAAERWEITEPLVSCSALIVTGNPQSQQGANWVYDSTEDGVHYVLEGVLFTPPGAGPFPAVVLSHGKGGTPRAYSANIARTMVGWGLVAIGTMYTHAPDAEDAGNLPDGPDGASDANVLRAHKARDLLSCLGTVDLTRVAAHGHSMGAFLTGQLLGTYPDDFRVASHTAGGVGSGPNATKPDVAARIRTPYALHHSDADLTVPLVMDQALAGILAQSGTEHRLVTAPYQGLSHGDMSANPLMLQRVRSWYLRHGLLP
jgi:dienelactone hydrolase